MEYLSKMLLSVFTCVIALTFLGIMELHLPVSAGGTANRVLTMYTDDEVSWNDAAKVCKAMGSQLITIDSEDVRLALQSYYTEMSWESSFWTGLHAVEVGNYVWHNCYPLGGYQPWYSKNLEYWEQCVLAKEELTKDSFWDTRKCFMKDGKAVCEKVEGECSFFTMSNKEVSGIEPLILSITSLDECKRACLDDHSSTECWGFHLIAGSPCSLYHAKSQSEFRAHFQNSSISKQNLYVKTCFSGKTSGIDLSPYISDKQIFSRTPQGGCSVVVTTTTTTTKRTTTVISSSSSLKPAGELNTKATTTTHQIATTKTTTARAATQQTTSSVIPASMFLISATESSSSKISDTNVSDSISSSNTLSTRLSPNDAVPGTTQSTRLSPDDAVPGTTLSTRLSPDDTVPGTTLSTRLSPDDTVPGTTLSTRLSPNDTVPGTTLSTRLSPDDIVPGTTLSTRLSPDDTVPGTTLSTRLSPNDAVPGKTLSTRLSPDDTVPGTTLSTRLSPDDIVPDTTPSTRVSPDDTVPSTTSETMVTANNEITTSSTYQTRGSVTNGSVESTTGRPDSLSLSMETTSSTPETSLSWSNTALVSGTVPTADLQEVTKTMTSVYNSVIADLSTAELNVTTSDHNTSFVSCMCRCRLPTTRLNDTEKKAFMDELVKLLTINKRTMSSTKRKYQSVSDPRPSAQSVGCVGIVLLGLTFVGLMVTDLRKLLHDLLRYPQRSF